jgi:methionine-rich copper-binding protein CopC
VATPPSSASPTRKKRFAFERVMRRRSTTAGLRSAAVLLVAGLFLSTPIVASAHAELVLSVPADGAVLGVTPGSVLLYFSEQIDPSLSEATVTGPGGETVTGPAAAARLIQVDLDTNLPGAYHVT